MEDSDIELVHSSRPKTSSVGRANTDSPQQPESSSRKSEPEDEADQTGCSSPAQDTSSYQSPGMKTSDFYKLDKNVPARFNNPECFKGYGKTESHPCYQKTSEDYGGKPPSVHTMPTKFYGRSQKFTGYYMRFGMYRNHSFNTTEDKSIA